MDIKICDKTYTVKFGYRTLAKTDVLDRVSEIEKIISGSEDENAVSKLKDLVSTTAELLLAGLQKKHDEFRFETEEDHSEKLDAIYDLMDDFSDEDTENGEDRSILGLFSMLSEELVSNGFLSKLSKKGESAVAEQDATVIPMDHQKKKK